MVLARTAARMSFRQLRFGNRRSAIDSTARTGRDGGPDDAGRPDGPRPTTGDRRRCITRCRRRGRPRRRGGPGRTSQTDDPATAEAETGGRADDAAQAPAKTEEPKPKHEGLQARIDELTAGRKSAEEESRPPARATGHLRSPRCRPVGPAGTRPYRGPGGPDQNTARLCRPVCLGR